jgi:hypothetical protein
MLQQAKIASYDLWSCLLLYYSDATGGKWLIDPSYEELSTLSNNMILATMLRRDGEEFVLIEKELDFLRTSYSVQQASSLSFKPCGLSLAKINEASQIAKAVCNKALQARPDTLNGDISEGYSVMI